VDSHSSRHSEAISPMIWRVHVRFVSASSFLLSWPTTLGTLMADGWSNGRWWYGRSTQAISRMLDK